MGGINSALGDPLGKDAAADATASAGRAQAAAYGRGIDEQRRQFDAVQALLAPLVGAGRDALPGLTEGSTVEGFDARIAQILGSDTFKALIGDRTKAVQNQLANAGLMRSGAGVEAAARIPTDLALAIEQALYGRTDNLAKFGQASATGQAAIGGDISGRISQLMGQQGEAIAGGIIGGQQARAAITGNLINAGTTLGAAALMMPAAPAAAAGLPAGVTMSAGPGAAGLFFSDPRLKENMQPIGKIGPLTMYEWDWKPSLRPFVGQMSIGFSADEVQEHFPQHVAVVHGFKVINYPALTDELRARYVGAEA